jgi:hypothetical protein
MTVRTLAAQERARGNWFFLFTFIFACFLFWWLPSILFRLVVHRSDAVEDQAVAASVLALCLFTAGYLLPVTTVSRFRFSTVTIDACGDFAFKASVLLFVPALIMAIVLLRSRTGITYGMGDPIPRPFQAVFYTHLFFGFMYLGAADPVRQGRRRMVAVVLLLTLPRLLESLHGGRFFLSQAVVPAILIATARGWIRFSLKRMLQFAALALVIVFLPPLTRGDDVIGQDETVKFFAAGSSLLLFQNNEDLNLSGRCPPLLVSLTAKTIPYGWLGLCVIDFSGLKNMPATLSRILTVNDPASFEGTVSGTGSNYMLELELAGGLPAVYAGSALFGFICRRFVGWIGMRSLFSGIWAECLTRALFAPRGDLGYVFERIPSLVLTTLLVVFAVWAWRLLETELSVPITASSLTSGGTSE